MICRRCLLRATCSGSNLPSRSRNFSQKSFNLAEAVTADKVASKPRSGSPDSRQPPSATSTSAAQPFSTPATPSPKKAGVETKAKRAATPLVQSSVAAGTPLAGLNFLKNATDPVAMKDEEYPPWLWTILEPKKKESAAQEVAEVLTKKQQKQRKKRGLDPAILAPKVPLQEQTIDLPSGDGTLEGALVAEEARRKLTKAMRENRRAKIKEANFLKAMG